MKEFCKKHGITENQFKGIEKINGSLHLSSLTTIPEGFNPTVGGWLYLSSLTTIPEWFNPTVGGSLDLNSHLKANYIKIEENSIFKNNGKIFIYADNVLAEVLKSKGNVYHIKIVGSKKETILVTDGKNFSHGETLKEAKEDLVYKITDRKKDDYKNCTLESVLSFEESVKCYRTITGACSQGTKNFVTSVLAEKKQQYTIQEIIIFTKGQYGAESFKNFFHALN